MTRFTNNNKLSLPIAVWTLMDNYNYDKRENVISATTLLKPVRQICLGMKFKDNLKVIDASDLINSSMGSALHKDIGISLARECPNNNYHVFKELYGMIPNEFKEKLYVQTTAAKRNG